MVGADVTEDGCEVLLAEAAGMSSSVERLVDATDAEKHREFGGLAHLGSDPRHTCGCGGGEPHLGTFAERQEVAFGIALRSRLGLERASPVRVVGVVLIEDAGLSRHRKLVAEDLAQASLVTPDDDQFLTFDSAPDLLVDPDLGQ